jgi:uncharacterized protein
MNLRDRLERNLGSHPPKEEKSGLREELEQLAGEKAPSSNKKAPRKAIEEVLDGKLIETPFGETILVRRHYPAEHRHGTMPLSTLFHRAHLIPAIPGRESGSPLRGLSISDFLFLDTETTGLSGGAGTSAFLIGAGFFEGGELKIHQHFMRDFNEEKAMLYLFSTLLGRARGLVTFNGRCFDVPLIDQRFILNKSRLNLRALPHLDLLYPSRRLFKGLFSDCRLVTLEKHVLEMKRHGDVDGSLIPACYFEYIRTGKSEMIEQIFSHNRHDIITLVALMAAIAGLIDTPLKQSGARLVKLGRFHQEIGDTGLGRECLESALQGSLEKKEKMEAARHLSLQYRREKRYDDAARLWKIMAEETPHQDPFPFIELAKYYERRKKNLNKAIEMTKRALAAIEQGSSALRADLKRRGERLERKLSADDGRNPASPLPQNSTTLQSGSPRMFSL